MNEVVSAIAQLESLGAPPSTARLAAQSSKERAITRGNYASFARQSTPTVDYKYEDEDVTDALPVSVALLVSKDRAPPAVDTSLAKGQPCFVVDDGGSEWIRAQKDASFTQGMREKHCTVLTIQALNQYYSEIPEGKRIRDQLAIPRQEVDPQSDLGSIPPVELETASAGIALSAPSPGAISPQIRYVGIVDDDSWHESGRPKGSPYKDMNVSHVSSVMRGTVHNVPNISCAKRWNRTVYILGGMWSLLPKGSASMDTPAPPYQLRMCSYSDNESPTLVPDLSDEAKLEVYNTDAGNADRETPLAFMKHTELLHMLEHHREDTRVYSAPTLFYEGSFTTRVKEQEKASAANTYTILKIPTLHMANIHGRMSIVSNSSHGNGDEYSQRMCQAAATSASTWKSLAIGSESQRSLLL